MRSFWPRLVCLFLFLNVISAALSAQQPGQVTLTGSVTSASGASVQIQLINCGQYNPRVLYNGSLLSVVVPQTYTATPDASGNWSVIVWPNDLLVCGGTTGASAYQVTYTQNGTPSGPPENFQVASTGPNPYSTTTQPPLKTLPPANAQNSNFDFQSLTLGNSLNAQTGSIGALNVKSLTINGQPIAAQGQAVPNTGGTVSGTLNMASAITLGPRVDVRWPGFGAGTPVLSLTANGSCTSNPTITISAPQGSLGTQATATGYCINGQIASAMSFPGGGYTSATCSISGGGTSSPSCSVNLMGTPNAADPTGLNDSTAAIQNAIDYAYVSAASTQVNASVYIPQGEYLLSHNLTLPCDEAIRGDGMASTVLDITDTDENGLTVTLAGQKHPDSFSCRGSLTNMEIYASQGHNYTATELLLDSTVGYTLRNLLVTGGGGRGVVATNGAERNFAEDIEIDNVRWPLLWMGNENHIVKLNIADPGASVDMATEPDGTRQHYCFGTGNCINGEYPSLNWQGGTLESAAANGTTATFYVHSSSTQYPNSPIIAGMHFSVVGTTGASLDGLYTATSVTNGVMTDPSGQCSSSNVCFEVQASSTVNGTATLTAPTTTATFNTGSYTIAVASTSGFSPWEFISGAGISSGTRITAISGTTLTISNATTAAETSETITGQTEWYPTIMPDANDAVTLMGADIAVTKGSIKPLYYANCFNDIGTLGSEVSSFYCEGYPVNGQPHVDSTFQYGGNPPYTTLSNSLTGSTGPQSEVAVADDSWFPNYINDRSLIYNPSSLGNNQMAVLLVAPADFKWGSTTPSAYVSGVQQGQYELVLGTFTQNNQLVVIQRDYQGSTAPSGTTWPAGSYIAFYAAKNGSGYGSLNLASMHANAIDPPNQNWAVGCNDQSSSGNVCGEFLIGSIVNEKGSFTTGQAAGSAGLGGASITFIGDEQWKWDAFNQGTEPLGQGFIKAVGQGGTATILDGTGQGISDGEVGYGYEATTGQLFRDGYTNVQSYDGSFPYAGFSNLDTGTWFTTGIGAYGEDGSAVSTIAAWPGWAGNPGSPTGSAVGKEFQNSYCYWDTSSQVDGHANTRWCFVGSPESSTPDFQMDTWSGSSWVNAFTLNASTLSNLTPLPRGTLALGTSAIAANSCASVQTVTVSGANTSMVAVFSGDGVLASSVAGYSSLKIDASVTAANTISVQICNPTASSITPGALTLNVTAMQ